MTKINKTIFYNYSRLIEKFHTNKLLKPTNKKKTNFFINVYSNIYVNNPIKLRCAKPLPINKSNYNTNNLFFIDKNNSSLSNKFKEISFYKSFYSTFYDSDILNPQKLLHNYNYLDNPNIPLKKNFENLFIILIAGTSGKSSIVYTFQQIFKNLKINSVYFTNGSYKFNKYDISYSSNDNKHNRQTGIISIERSIKNKFNVTLSTPNSIILPHFIEYSHNNKVKLLFCEYNKQFIRSSQPIVMVPDILLIKSERSDLLKYSNSFQIKKDLKFFKNLLRQSKKSLLILNIDSHLTKVLQILKTPLSIFSNSLTNEKAELYPKKIMYSVWGTMIYFEGQHDTNAIETKLIGKHNLENLLNVISIANILKLSKHYLYKSLEEIEKIPRKTERIDFGQSFNVLVDYGCSPESLEILLSSLYETCNTKLIIIYGVDSGLDHNENKEIYTLLTRFSKKLFLTNSNSRWISINTLLKETF